MKPVRKAHPCGKIQKKNEFLINAQRKQRRRKIMALTTATTAYGRVEGLAREDKDITEFRGIPYAKPPIGELRFRPPVPAEPWQGTLMCKEWPLIPPQVFFPLSSELYPKGYGETGEDCLYLNVYTSAPSPDVKQPVFLWYHDGGLTNGWAFDPRNDPSFLVEKDIVVVTVGHRLGVLGYMTLPQLTKEQGQSGNYGLMDTILALKWIHENIAAFGGDPDKITLAAESGGTYKCAALVANPELKGLFRRVISQSGFAWKYPVDSQKAAEELGIHYLQTAGIDPDITPEELRFMDLDKLLVPIDPHDMPANMTADGLFLTEDFADCFEANSRGVDFMNSVCSGEAFPDNQPFHSREEFFAYFRRILGDLYDTYHFEDLVSVTDENAWAVTLDLSSRGLAPADRSRPRIRSNFCRNMMLNGYFANHVACGHVYNMRFGQTMPPRTDIPSEPDIAAPHGSDLWYSFGTLRLGYPPSRPWREEDVKVSEMFTEYISNFVKTGDPNGEGLPVWPEANKSMGWLDFSIHSVAHEDSFSKLDELILAYTRRQHNL